MKKFFLLSILTVASFASQAVAPYGTLPTQAHLDYHKRDIIAIVHWGPNTYTGQEWGFGNVDPSRVTPDNLDPEQWVEAMAAGGIKAVILVCKHHDGFCLWPSKVWDGYSMASVPGKYKGFNVVKAVEKACRKRNMAFGAYLSPWDRRRADYGAQTYVEYFHAQWDELMTDFGDICEIWLDGANGGDGWYGGVNGGKGERRSIPNGYYQKPRLLAALHAKHPNAVAFGGHYNWSIKWCGNERGTSPETWWNPSKGDDGKEYWMPSEADTPFRRGWFFHAHESPKPMNRLVDMYFESVGRGAVLNLGIAPDKRGLVCEADVKRLKEFGDWVREFNKVDFAAIPGAKMIEEFSGNTLVWTLKMPKAVKFECVDFKEKIELGQRVESFVVEAKINGLWQVIARGTTVGVRRLARCGDVTASEVRVTLKGRAKPVMDGTLALRQIPAYAQSQLARRDTLPKQAWRIIDETCKTPGNAKNAIDGNEKTLWHTHPVGRASIPPPQSFSVDCAKVLEIKGFDYVPRTDCLHGVVDEYEFAVSDDGKNWRTVKVGKIGNLAANPVRNRITLDKPEKARYFRFTATHSISGNNQCTLAEIDLF